MVHTGKPSGACQGCKRRHIKCDETRPACNRCTASNRVCPGYKDGLDLVLRDQNVAAKALVERRTKAAATKKRSQPRSPMRDEDDEDEDSDDVANEMAMRPQISESEETHAFCLFMSSWVLYERDPRADRNIPECLSFVLTGLHVDSALSRSVNALSRCLFRAWERRNRDFTGVVPIQKAYVHALGAVRSALADPATATSDETLMAVCLIAMYEALCSAFQARVSNPRHFEGALAIVAQRKAANTMTAMTRSLLNAIKCHIAFRALTNATAVDTKASVWRNEEDSADEQTYRNPATILDAMTAETANVLAAEKALLAEYNTDSIGEDDARYRMADLLDEARTVEASLSLWPTLVPNDWHPIPLPKSQIPASVVNAGLYSATCDIYPDIIVCSTWNDWRATRLRVLQLIGRLESGGGIGSPETKAAIKRMVDGLCDSVPYSLGSRMDPAPMFATHAEYPSISGVQAAHHPNAALFGGWYLVCSLKETLNCAAYLDQPQIFWLSMQLRRCATIYDVVPQKPKNPVCPPCRMPPPLSPSEQKGMAILGTC